MISTLRASIRRRGWPRVVLEILCVVQVLHLGEHVAQMIQLYVLGWPPAVARGVVSNLDVEKVHFIWNFGVLAALIWLIVRGQRSPWLVATLAWAALHTSEHGFLLTSALLSGVEGAPGILGAGGVLARHGWDAPGLTTWSRATIHFAWNSVEVVLLCVAYVVTVTPRIKWLRAPGWLHAGPRAMLAISLLIPSTAGAPVDNVTSLAPVEIWVDGFGHVAGIAIDRDDNLFLADRDRGTVTRVARDRRRTVVASGLDRPMGLALDATGRLLVAEEGGERVVRIETNGKRTPVVTGIRHPRWLAVSEAGVLYISARRAPGVAEDDDPMTVLALRPGGRLDVFADDFKQLEALAVDNGFLFVAAKGRHGDGGSDGTVFRITVGVDGTAGAITAHGPRDRFKRPVGLARDHLGALYLTTPELETPKAKDAVAKLHGTGNVTRFAADLRDPRGLAFDGEGHLYVADGRVGRVLRFRAPPPPVLETFPAVTGQPSITVRGTTEARARADLAVNESATLISTVADTQGKFALVAPLAPNVANALAVLATTHQGDGLTSAAAEATVSHDGVAPSLQFKSPAAGGFVRGGVTVQAEAADGGSGVVSITLSTGVAALPTVLAPPPPAAAVTGTAAWDTTSAADGTHTLSATVIDRAGNTRTATRAVIVDNTAPDTQIVSGPSGDVADAGATFTFAGNDNLAPAANLTFAWRLDGAAFGSFSTATTASVSGLGEGPHTFEVKARDVAGNEDPTPAVRSFTVSLRPTVGTLTPSSGPVGTLVTITGSGFVPDATQVSFNGVSAVVRSITPTVLTATVPLDARSGPVAVTTFRGTGTSAQPFTVTLSQDFAVHSMPAAAQLVQGTSTTYTIALVGDGGALFTGLATLSVAGLPSGVTAAFAPAPTVSGSQLRTLTLTATSSAALGLAAITISAGATLDGAGVTRAASVTVDVIAGGRTAALGQVTFRDGAPIAGVRLTLAGASATTDAGGNFRILDVPAGPQMLGIDANAAQAGLPIYGVEVTLVAGQATQLAPFRITPPPPLERFAPIANGATAQVISDPRFPGASITLPAGVTITGWDGTVKSRMAIERLSPDALPVPPPPGVTRSLYQVFFGTPMGGLPSAPLPVTVPNDQDLEPGEKAEIWYYDAAPVPGVPAGWRLAGLGTVSADGSRVVSDPGVGLSRFCGACGLFCIVRNLLKQLSLNLWGPRAAEPVDLGTGLMIVDKTDLVLPGRVPAVLRRSYNPLDPFGRVAGFELATGPGWTLTVDVVLLQETPSLRRLILPGNARFAFVLQPDGTFTNSAFPAFAGAVLRIHTDGGHTLRFKDGSTWRFATGYFPRVGPPVVLTGLSLLVAQSDRTGNTLAITRDRFGAPSQVTEPGGRTLSFNVDLVDAGVGRLLTVTDPIGRTVRYGYSATAPFRLETVTDPVGGVTRYTYNAFGGIVGITDPRGITFLTNEHDGDGRVVRQTQADGGVWTIAYTGSAGAHTSATVTDPRGHRTIYRLDNAGFGSETIDALGQVTRRERDAAGRVTATTDPLGRVTRVAYDAVGNVTGITDPLGNARTFAYEPTFNRVTSLTDPLGQVTRLEYDGAGNMTAIVDPSGRRRTFTYNAAGQPLTAADPLGNVTRFEYDTAGNLTVTVDPLGHRTVREYDSVSRLTRQIDALGGATSMGYDFLNRVETLLDALGGVTRFAYDGNGNLLTLTDPRGSVTTHTYDTMDRLATRTDPVGARESFAHDPLGNPTRHTDRKGQVALFTHDALNRRVRSSYVDATADVVYDAGGRLVSAFDSADGTILNRYDAMDRLLGQTTTLGDITYAYDSLGRRTTMTASGQPPVTYAYDSASRLTSITQAGRSVQFQHDSAGRRTRLLLPNQASTEYQYDVAGRLTALTYHTVSGPIGDLAYHYDPTGSLLARGGSLARTLLPAPVTSATYDPANRHLSRNGISLRYDANGNLTLDGTTTYTWDARNRVSSLSGTGRAALFTYDALGRRVHKDIDGAATRLHYDGLNPIQLFSGTGAAASILTGPAVDEFFTITESANQRTLLTDLLGSTIAELDQTGSLSADYTYDPFGLTSTTDQPRSPFQYTGRENDGTGLYHYRNRYYSPSLHRFISEDPLGLRDGTNRYAYVRNRPTTATDPLGLLTVIVHGVGLGRPNAGYSGELGKALIEAGETVVEVRWNGNPFSVEGTSSAIQRIVEAAQQAAQSGEPLNIIGHSWGSVLAANALASTGITAENLITLGSPLSNSAAFPAGANNWMNIGSPVDPISWGAFKLPAEQFHTWLFHVGYWNDPWTIASVVGRITGRK